MLSHNKLKTFITRKIFLQVLCDMKITGYLGEVESVFNEGL